MSITDVTRIQASTPQAPIDTNTQQSNISPADQQVAQAVLNMQAAQTPAAQTNAVSHVKTDPASLSQAVQALQANTSTGSELIQQLESQIQHNPALKDDAPALCQTIKILLNTCLTGRQDEKDAALNQLQGQLTILTGEGVNKDLLDSISQKAQVFHDGNVVDDMSEAELLNMVRTVIENSEHANLGENFANVVHEQITAYNSASSQGAKEAHMRELASSMAILQDEYVSNSMLNTLADADRFNVSSTNVSGPEVPVPDVPISGVFLRVQGDAQRTADLTSLLEKFGNAARTAEAILIDMPEASFNALLDATHNLATGSNEAHIAFTDRLDDAFMSHAEIRQELVPIKEECIKELDTASQDQIKLNHVKHRACSIIVNALPDGHELKGKALTDITHTDILGLIQNNAQLRLPDIALCNTYFLLGEGAQNGPDASGHAISTDDLAKALPKAWLGSALYSDLAQRGISSTAQLDEGMSILSGSILSRSAKKSMISLISTSHSGANAQQAEDNLHRLATHLLDIDSGASIDNQSLLALCAKRFDLTLPQDTGIIGAYGVLTQKEGYTAHVDTTFNAMTQAQTPTGTVPNPKDTKGETLAYTVLTLQRSLVRDVKELSALDLSTLGASADDVKDPASLKHFVENVWQDGQKNDWATAVLLKSYLDAGGNDARCTRAHPALRDNAQLFQPISTEAIQGLTLFDHGLVAQLDKGRTASSGWTASGKSDPAGQLLKDLARRYCDMPTDGSKAASEVTVSGMTFAPANADKETLRKAIIALTNGNSVTINGQERTYLCPADCAHASMLNKHQKELRGTNRIQDAHQKATIRGATDTVVAAQIQRDFVQLVGIADRQGFAADALLKEFMTTLNKNPNFASRAKPLALLDAQRQCNVAHVSDLFTPANQAAAEAALTQSLRTMGIGEAESALAAKGIMAEHNSILSQAFDTMGERILTAYTMRSDARRLAEAPEAMKSFVEIDRIQQNTLKVLEELPENTAFSLNHTASATATVGGTLGAVELSASIKLGEQDGVTLWRSKEQGGTEKFGLSISRTYLAGLEASASVAELLTLEAGAEGGIEKGLVLEFDTKEDCAHFASLFLSNAAKREDIRLASQVHLGDSYSIAGSVSVGVGVEKEVGVCTLALGANASISGKVHYSKSVSGDELTTTSTSSIKREAAVNIEASIEGSTDVPMGSHIEDGSASIESARDRAFLEYEDLSTHTTKVVTNAAGTSLISAETVTGVSIDSGSTEDFEQFCTTHNIPPDVAREIQSFLSAYPSGTVTIEAHYKLTNAALSTAVRAQPIHTVINDASSYKIASVSITSSEDGHGLGFDLGFLQNQTESQRTTTKAFVV